MLLVAFGGMDVVLSASEAADVDPSAASTASSVQEAEIKTSVGNIIDVIMANISSSSQEETEIAKIVNKIIEVAKEDKTVDENDFKAKFLGYLEQVIGKVDDKAKKTKFLESLENIISNCYSYDDENQVRIEEKIIGGIFERILNKTIEYELPENDEINKLSAKIVLLRYLKQIIVEKEKSDIEKLEEIVDKIENKKYGEVINYKDFIVADSWDSIKESIKKEKAKQIENIKTFYLEIRSSLLQSIREEAVSNADKLQIRFRDKIVDAKTVKEFWQIEELLNVSTKRNKNSAIMSPKSNFSYFSPQVPDEFIDKLDQNNYLRGKDAVDFLEAWIPNAFGGEMSRIVAATVDKSLASILPEVASIITTSAANQTLDGTNIESYAFLCDLLIIANKIMRSNSGFEDKLQTEILNKITEYTKKKYVAFSISGYFQGAKDLAELVFGKGSVKKFEREQWMGCDGFDGRK